MSEVIKSSLLAIAWYILMLPLKILRNVVFAIGALILGMGIFAVAIFVGLTVLMTSVRVGAAVNPDDPAMFALFGIMAGFVSACGTVAAFSEVGKVVRKTSRGQGMAKGVKS